MQTPAHPADRDARRRAMDDLSREWAQRVRRHATVMWVLSCIALTVGGLAGWVDWRPGMAVSGALALTVVGWISNVEHVYPLGASAVAVRERIALMAVSLAGFGLGLVGTLA